MVMESGKQATNININNNQFAMLSLCLTRASNGGGGGATIKFANLYPNDGKRSRAKGWSQRERSADQNDDDDGEHADSHPSRR